MSILNRSYFREEQATHDFLESILWPEGTICPHCGGIGKAYRIAANPTKRVRHDLWKCGHCRKQFRVKMGTVFEHARIPLYKCLQAAYLLCASKKGVFEQSVEPNVANQPQGGVVLEPSNQGSHA